ncbi:MAG TPA: biotin/lipoate A/B protein ligase family protein [Anaerolineae bacterium]|nr:biotin/lipoate A/B protein ligase family protein [Anaerolineae bacterium]HOQ97479.1 biotin/lipoate A/B protein ligase family protein [Anaerolineae bacterium]HPL29645.1 biotin/lipoate A/B protein ligase family protein [Anaerolineae bacterium]
MDLYRLGAVSWQESQLIYHALPRLGLGGLVILRPSSPYVCIGYHQDAAQEVDLAYCRACGIPVFRREVGGGAVYLDGGQIFYQLVLDRRHPLAQGAKEDCYRRLLASVVAVYRDLGLDATYKPVNDILVDGRKISGNGAGEIADAIVLVGNLIVDFDYDTMARVLRVPDEKFRDKVHQSLRENLTTLRRELPELPDTAALEDRLVQRFAEVLGTLTPQPLPEAVRREAARLAPELTSEAWLLRRGTQGEGRRVRIRSGAEVAQRAYKAPGGLIRATVEVHDGRFVAVDLSGDLFMYPAERLDDLAAALVGTPCASAEETVAAFFAAHGIEAPGITPADVARVVRIAT